MPTGPAMAGSAEMPIASATAANPLANFVRLSMSGIPPVES
jgi:hypothetical protein